MSVSPCVAQRQFGLSLCKDLLACLFAKAAVAPSGQTTSALYNASEALRLGSILFSSLSPDRAAAVTDLAQPSALPSASSHQISPSGPLSEPSHRSRPAQDAVQDSTTDPATEQAEDSTFAAEAGPIEAAVAQGGVRGGDGADGVGFWQVTWLYLTSLLKLGEVYEVAGSHEDALHAFREGQELVRIIQLLLIIFLSYLFVRRRMPSTGIHSFIEHLSSPRASYIQPESPCVGSCFSSQHTKQQRVPMRFTSDWTSLCQLCNSGTSQFTQYKLVTQAIASHMSTVSSQLRLLKLKSDGTLAGQNISSYLCWCASNNSVFFPQTKQTHSTSTK